MFRIVRAIGKAGDFLTGAATVVVVATIAVAVTGGTPAADAAPAPTAVHDVVGQVQGEGYGTGCAPAEELVLRPDGAVSDTTPMVPVPDTCYVVPEESPDGGHVQPYDRWLDNSPTYDGPDRWFLFVDDARRTISWRVRDESAAADDTPQVRTVAATQAPRPAAGSCSEPLPTPPSLVNVNTATVAQIMALPHVDKVLTKRITDQRAVRPFTSIDDLRSRVSRFPTAVVPLVTV